MFELTNAQRRCFALPPVLDTWERIEVTPNPCDMYYAFAYLDGAEIKKVIQIFDEQPGHDMYCEYSVDARLSEDRTRLMPKTDKGKLVKFNSTNLSKRLPNGMVLSFARKCISLANASNQVSFYNSSIDDVKAESLIDFSEWIDQWCRESGEHEIAEITAFSQQPRIHQKYHEGDFFRFRINRRLHGYGRILLDYNKLRKSGKPFWDIFMGKPLCVAVYHVATENPSLTPDDLCGRMMLPSQIIMDNIFYYGECKIIGNAPVTESEQDYPIHYGNTIRVGEKGVRYQCGKTFASLDDEDELYHQFRNSGIGWSFNMNLPILRQCIDAHSNQPYWDNYSPVFVNRDLRNPKYVEQAKRVKLQMGVE